jgi:hypothetical protein
MRKQKDFIQRSFLEVKLDLLGIPTPYKKDRQVLMFLLQKAYQQNYPEIIKFDFKEYMDYMKYFFHRKEEAFNELKMVIKNLYVSMKMDIRGSYHLHNEFIFRFKDNEIRDDVEFLDKCYIKCVPELVKVVFYSFVNLDDEMKEWYNGKKTKRHYDY